MYSKNLTFQTLPVRLPIFPLTGVLLLPHGQLPLNIFEPRYLQMVDDALASDRMIGMIQPRKGSDTAVYDYGCAGRITSFTETDDGRYLVTLAGTCRFKIAQEIDVQTPYRQLRPDWNGFEKDLCPEAKKIDVDRDRLNELLQRYFDMQEMSCDWGKIEITTSTELLTALAMICPFEPCEKQALLEAENAQARTELFLTLIEMCVHRTNHYCEN